MSIKDFTTDRIKSAMTRPAAERERMYGAFKRDLVRLLIVSNHAEYPQQECDHARTRFYDVVVCGLEDEQ